MERNNDSDSSIKRALDDILEEARKVSKDEEERLMREAMRLMTEAVANKLISYKLRKMQEDDHSPVGKEEDHPKKRMRLWINNPSINIERRKPKKKSVDMVEEIPDEFRREIESLGGGNIKLVLARRLTHTDTAPGQNKLSLPFNQLRYRFIRPDEDEIIRQNKEVDIMLIEPSLMRCHNMRLEWWPQGQGVYALNGEWKHVLKRNKNVLEKGAYVQVWSFRIRTPTGSGVEDDKEGELGFALVVPSSGGGEEQSTGSTKTEDSSSSGNEWGTSSTKTEDSSSSGNECGASSTKTQDSRSGNECGTSSTKTRDSSSGKECDTSSSKPEDIGSSIHDTISDRD